MENSDLKSFLENTSSNIKEIKNITTASSHKRIILNTLNSLLYEHPEWSYSIYSLSEYTEQKWAIEQDVKINKFDIFKKIGYQNGCVDKYECTLQILEIIDKMVLDEFFKLKTFKNKYEFMAFEAAHDLTSDDVSKYIMTNYYKQAVINFCKKHNKDIVKLFKTIKKDKNKLFKDEKIIYHDGDMLLKTIRAIIKKKRVLNIFEEEELFRMLSKLLSVLDNFKLNGTTLSNILNKYVFDGKSDLDIAKEMYCSETFVRTKRIQATKLLSYLLWGYSSKEMLKNGI